MNQESNDPVQGRTTGDSVFETLSKVDVTPFVEINKGFAYLPWAIAYRELMSRYPDSTVETVHFDGKPYCAAPSGYMVEVAVTVRSMRRTVMLPVMDENFATIEQPNAFDINTSIQRCSVKAIAMHGLGIQLYAREGLVLGETTDSKSVTTQQQPVVTAEKNPAPGSQAVNVQQAAADAEDAQKLANLSARLTVATDVARMRISLTTVKFNKPEYMEKFKTAMRARLNELGVPLADVFGPEAGTSASPQKPSVPAQPATQPQASKPAATPVVNAPVPPVATPQSPKAENPVSGAPDNSTFW